jgi:NCS1 family nucleobase:cation symporter-1
VFGHPIWSPVELLGKFHQPWIAFFGLIALLVATLNVNIGANVVGPSNDFSNLAPRLISFRTGGLITGALGLAIMPWRLVSSSHNFLGFLVDYSGLLGPVAGIMVADYFLVRRTKLDTYSLYRRGGVYEYRHGFNVAALIALTIGIVVALVGRFVLSLDALFKMAWFVGFFLSGAIYYGLMIGQRGRAAEGEGYER